MGMMQVSGKRSEVVASRSDADALWTQVSDVVQDKGYILARLDNLVNWARAGSLWPMTFGLAC